MGPSALLRTLSRKLSDKRQSNSTIIPWPPAQSPLDRWLTSELDALRRFPEPRATATWLSKSLDLAIASQSMALRTIQFAASSSFPMDRGAIGRYLDDVVDLLDACSSVPLRAEGIRTQISSIATAIHRLDCFAGPPVDRAIAELSAFTVGAELDRCISVLRLAGEREAGSNSDVASDIQTELREALDGPRALAFLVMGAVVAAMSSKPRRRVLFSPREGKAGSWTGGLYDIQKEVKEEFDRRRKEGSTGLMIMEELRLTAAAALTSKELVRAWSSSEGTRWVGEQMMREAVEELRRRNEELKERVAVLEAKVGELYRQLVAIRMFLLGLLSES
ncbi:hypothetical protein HPP92_024086 [Vanilla planifolia]|uniref:Uncharacterized protein n=1 Tax=Vanilla planifolia TaxID=51239 RepID=A0A835PP33_VANPL|nr:hypothetical protein HPP92_024086 [Vanilla planifolia]